MPLLRDKPLFFTCDPDSHPNGILTEHMLERCASECVRAAQNTISIITQYSMLDICTILPAWWFRVYYMYTAAMVLAVSTLRLDMFPRSTTEAAWQNAQMFFQENEHLSEAVKVCKSALQRMVTRIEQIEDNSTSARLVNGDPGREGFADIDFSNLLQDLPFHFDFESIFNAEHTL
ncbi:hypothetical protein yc1106_05220 [Curvularia clavata]|uniref:Transcription factor domain-containing protein n=1 Tax=Curvularia clavata TaxID=95742 RepID=A0A9Q9DU02_CURCL|nr:hypothetical protein yc1106_05220 [Curvularia clavata]